MVIFVAMTAMLVGAALGQRFKVFALVPTVLLFSLAIFAYGIIHNNNLWSAFVVTVLALISLQFGYFTGSVLRFLAAEKQFKNGSPRAMMQRTVG